LCNESTAEQRSETEQKAVKVHSMLLVPELSSDLHSLMLVLVPMPE
jgi:hypothetical protein